MGMNCWIILVTVIIATAGSPTGQTNDIAEQATGEEKIFKGYTECRNHDDCESDQCCTLGMQRYSIATCTNFGLVNDPCIPNKPSPRNFTLSYPNTRTAVEVQSAYLLYCPCDKRLSCDRNSNSCQDPLTIK